MVEAGTAEPKKRVLIIEDEASIRRGLCDVLLFRGACVQVAIDGGTGLELALREPWDLIVLDIMLPVQNGFVVCERLRAQGKDVPVLILTAKDDEDDIVRGFEAGANDYVTKPFSVRELTARLDALLRRSPRALPVAFRLGPLEVNGSTSQARDGNETFDLTAREVRILRALSHEPGRIVSRRELLRDVWDMNNADELTTRTVDVHVAKLRKKLGRHGSLLVTTRGQGYRWRG